MIFRDRAGAFLANRCAGNWERVKVKVSGHWRAKFKKTMSVKPTVFYTFKRNTLLCSNTFAQIGNKVPKDSKVLKISSFRAVQQHRSQEIYICICKLTIQFYIALHYISILYHWSYHYSYSPNIHDERFLLESSTDSSQFLWRSIYDLRWIFSWAIQWDDRLRNFFLVVQINIGYFCWFPQDDNTIFALLGHYDVYGLFRIRLSHCVAGAPEEQNDSEYEQNGN